MSNPIRIVRDKKYLDMYRLKWKDGEESADFYNLTRAKDILKNYAEYKRREGLSKNNHLLSPNIDAD